MRCWPDSMALLSASCRRHRLIVLLLTCGLFSVCADAEYDRFIAASDVASFLGISAEEPLTLPTEVNLAFVGFNGDGEAGLNISEAQLAPWFQQLRALTPHSVLRAPNDGLAVPLTTAVRYATRLHVLRLPPEVTARVEELLAGHLRPEALGPAGPGATLQMSAHLMSHLLGSLARTLRLPGFTLFVLNPRR